MKVIDISRRPNPDVIALLESWLADAKRGEIITVGIVGCAPGGEWHSSFSSSADVRIDAAMLMELAMRRLGFEPKGAQEVDR